jgi:hypothetical protein
MVSVAVSLARVGPPAEAARQRVLRTQALCPFTGSLARVQIGYDARLSRLSVVGCEHFPTGQVDCDRDCFPTLVLTPLREASAA